MIDFYISIQIVLIGAFFAMTMSEKTIEWARYLDAASIFIVTVVFYGLDKRTRHLIRQVGSSLENLEKDCLTSHGVPELALISKLSKKPSDPLNLPYKAWIYCLYLLVGIMGIVFIVLIAFKKI